MKEYSFEKLEVWKDAKDLLIEIYISTNEFPNDEKYGLISQMRRAILSVTNNLAEGSSRKSEKDKRRFIEISYGSLMEVLNCLIISKELNHIENNKYEDIRQQIGKISNKLNSLANYYNQITK